LLLEIINGNMILCLDLNIQKTVKRFKHAIKLTGLGAGALKKRGGTGGIRRRWGLSIVRSSRSFRCAAIRARRGVFGGVSLSLLKKRKCIENQIKEGKKVTYINQKSNCCRAEEAKLQ
jgi:hypothetical protein